MRHFVGTAATTIALCGKDVWWGVSADTRTHRGEEVDCPACRLRLAVMAANRIAWNLENTDFASRTRLLRWGDMCRRVEALLGDAP